MLTKIIEVLRFAPNNSERIVITTTMFLLLCLALVLFTLTVLFFNDLVVAVSEYI